MDTLVIRKGEKLNLWIFKVFLYTSRIWYYIQNKNVSVISYFYRTKENKLVDFQTSFFIRFKNFLPVSTSYVSGHDERDGIGLLREFDAINDYVSRYIE